MLQPKVVVKELGEKPVPTEARVIVGAWLVKQGHSQTFGLKLNDTTPVTFEQIEGRERVQHLDISRDAKTLSLSVITNINGEMHDCNCDLVRIPSEPLGDVWESACKFTGDPRRSEDPDDDKIERGDILKGKPMGSAWRNAQKTKFKCKIVLTTLASFVATNGGQILWPEHRDEIKQAFRIAGHPEYADVGNKSMGNSIFGFSKKAGFLNVTRRKSPVAGGKFWTFTLTEKTHDFLAGRVSIRGKIWKSKIETRLARNKSVAPQVIDTEIVKSGNGNGGGSVKNTMLALMAQVMSVSRSTPRDGDEDSDEYDPEALAALDELDATGLAEILEPHKDQVRALRQIECWKKKILGQLPPVARKAFRLVEESRDTWEAILDPDR